jgi:hypothetical protein
MHLEFLNEFLKYVRGNTEPFGGIQVVFAMDPLQFTVLMQDKELAEIKRNCGNNTNLDFIKVGFYHSALIIGPNWLYGILNVNIRSQNPRWATFLKNARRSELTEDDFKWFLEYSGSNIPHILKMKWLLINFIINGKYDKGNESFVYRLRKGYILSQHHDKIKSLETISKNHDKIKLLEASSNRNVTDIDKVTVLTTERVSLHYGNWFNAHLSHNTEKLSKVIMEIRSSEYRKDTVTDSILTNLNDFVNLTLSNIKDISAKSDIHSNKGIIECTAEDEYGVNLKDETKMFEPSNDDKAYYSEEANKKLKQQKSVIITKGTIVFCMSNCQIYLHTNQKLVVKEQLPDSLRVEPLYSNGLKGPDRYIKKELVEFEVKGIGKYRDETVIVKRMAYPIVLNSALMVKSSMGIQLDAALFDNTRCVQDGETYIAAGRVPMPEAFGLLHIPESVDELNDKYFKCNIVSKKLDTYLNERKSETKCNLISINFEFDYAGEIKPIESEKKHFY